MPGVPLDAKGQVKQGLKRLFRKRQKAPAQDADASYSQGDSHTSEPPTAPAVPERYDDEVEYQNQKIPSSIPAAVGSQAIAESQSQPSAEAVGPFADRTYEIAHESKAGEDDSSPTPAAVREEALVATRHHRLNSKASSDDATTLHSEGIDDTEDSVLTNEQPQKTTGMDASSKPEPGFLTDRNERGSPLPAMSATSGPLEDNPTFA